MLSLDNLTCRWGTQGVSLAITQQKTRMQPQLGYRLLTVPLLLLLSFEHKSSDTGGWG